MQKVTGSTPVTSTKGSDFIRTFFMSFIVYILYSSAPDQYYIGHTENIGDRILRHNNSGSKSAKKANRTNAGLSAVNCVSYLTTWA